MSDKNEAKNPFIEAVWNEDGETILRLLEEGTDISSVKDEYGGGPLHVAVKTDSLELIQLLVERGDDPFSLNDEGWGLLHEATFAEYTDQTLPYLLELGLDPNLPNIYGSTPVHYAIMHKNPSALKILLENGGNPHIRTNKGEDSFDIAKEMGYTDMSEILESYRDTYQPPDEEELSRYRSPESTQEDPSSISPEIKEGFQSDLIVEEDHSGNPDSLERVRKTASLWAEGIPHHGIKQFGSAIEIQKVLYRPAYLMGLSTLYDNRKVTEQTVPYTGQPLPEREYSSTSEVNPWDYSLMDAESFRSAQDSVVIRGSQFVAQCSRCSGQGKLTCPSCGGKGKDTCSSCGGRGKSRCHSCGGTGQTSCGACGGRGNTPFNRIDTTYDSEGNAHHNRYVEYHTCSSCGGSGRKRCGTCGGSGESRCSRCGGSGIIVCSRCSGSGAITCPTCQGRGQLYHFYTIDQTLNTQVLTRCILERHVFERYPHFYIDPTGQTGKVVSDETAVSLAEDLLDRTHLYESYRNTLSESRNNSPFQNGSTHIVRQNNRIVRMDVYDVEYRYEDQLYHLLVWGWGEDFQVYAQESPFSKLRDQFLEKAEKRYKARIWGKAFNWLDKADDLDVFNEEERIYQLKEETEKKMFRQYRLGLIGGGLISAAGLGWLSLRFFRGERYYLPWAAEKFNEMKTAPVIQSYWITGLFILFLVLSHNRLFRFMKKYFNNKIRHEWMRWVLSPLTAVIGSLGIWLGIWIVNASGLTLIVTGLIQGILNMVPGMMDWLSSLA